MIPNYALLEITLKLYMKVIKMYAVGSNFLEEKKKWKREGREENMEDGANGTIAGPSLRFWSDPSHVTWSFTIPLTPSFISFLQIKLVLVHGVFFLCV